MLTTEQQAVRATGWGASEAAAVIGRSRYGSPIEAVLKKRGVAKHETSEPMKWGNRLESVVLDAYEEEMQKTVLRSNSVGVLRSNKFPHVLCTPDALDVTGLIHPKTFDPAAPYAWAHRTVQAKTCRFADRHEWGNQGTDAVPDEYFIQVQVEMGVLGLKEADLPVLFGGNDFRVFHVEFSQELFESIADRLERAWRDYIEGDSLPKVDGTQGYQEWLTAKFAERKDKFTREADEEETKLLAELKTLQASLTPSEERINTIKNELRARIKDSYGISADGVGKVLWVGGEMTKKTEWKPLAEAALASLEIFDKDGAAFLLSKFTRQEPSQRILRPYWND
jgi:putative phage-type endonuclease